MSSGSAASSSPSEDMSTGSAKEVVEFRVTDMTGCSHVYLGDSMRELRLQVAISMGVFYPSIVLLPFSTDTPMEDWYDLPYYFHGLTPPYEVSAVNNEESMKEDMAQWGAKRWLRILELHIARADEVALERFGRVVWASNESLEEDMYDVMQDMIERGDTFDQLNRFQGRINVMMGLGMALDDPGQMTLLHRAAEVGHVELLGTLLRAPDINVNAEDGHDGSPLHYAAKYGHVDAVRTLLKKNANAELVEHRRGQSPLHLAAYGGHAHVVALLIRSDVDVNVMNNEGYTALHEAVTKKQRDVIHVLKRAGARKQTLRP